MPGNRRGHPPDIPFRHSVNPYRDCTHGYAHLARGCLEVRAEARDPVCIVTRSPLVARHADVLAALTRAAALAPLSGRGTLNGPLEHPMSDDRSVLDALPHPAAIYDLERGLIAINPRAVEMLGRPEPALLGREPSVFMVSSSGSVRGNVQRALQDGSYTMRQVSSRADGSEFAVEVHLTRLTSSSVLALMHSLEGEGEIERIRAEHHSQAALDTMGELVLILSPDLRVQWANRAAREASPGKLCGQRCHEVWKGSAEPCPDCPVRETLRTGAEAEGRSEAAGRSWLLRSYPVHAPDGSVIGAVEVARDITDRVHAERALLQSEARYRAVVDAQSELVCRWAPDGVLTFANHAMVRTFGGHTLIGRHLDALHHPDDPVLALLTAAAPTRTRELRLVLPDSTIHWVQWTDTAILAGGEVVEVQSVGRDVSARRAVEERLRIQHELTTALAQAPDLDAVLEACLAAAVAASGGDSGGVYLVEPDGRLVLTRHQGLGAAFVELTAVYPADSPNAALVRSGRSVYSGYPLPGFDVHLVLESEGLRSAAIVPVRGREGVVACVNVASHTHDGWPSSARAALEGVATLMGGAIERGRLQGALAESQANLQALFDKLDDFLFVVDAQTGGLLDVNPVVPRRLGYTHEQVLGLTILDMHPPDRREEAGAIVAKMVQGKEDICPIPLLTTHGTTIPVETKVTVGTWGGRPAIFGISRDITSRIAARQALEHSLRERDAHLREIHHRVKNNMQVISSLLRLQGRQASDPAFTELLQESFGRVRAMALVHEILYRSDSLAHIELSTYGERLVRSVVRGHANRRVSLDLDLPDAQITMDQAVPCGLVLNELVTNALKHGRGESLRVGGVRDGADLTLWVVDDGGGLDDGFDLSQSRSLGLRLVRGLVQDQLGGAFSLESTGDGTRAALTFTLRGA